MTVLALTDAQASMWGWLLVVGAVVLVVVVVLLHTLLRAVREVDEGAAAVWHAATNVARNTATTWQLGQTAAALDAVRDEAVAHDELLREVDG